MEGGTGAAPFPDSWYVEANRMDRLDDILADSPAKRAAQERGEAYQPFPMLGTGTNSVPGVTGRDQ
jgi:hypothetical protein